MAPRQWLQIAAGLLVLALAISPSARRADAQSESSISLVHWNNSQEASLVLVVNRVLVRGNVGGPVYTPCGYGMDLVTLPVPGTSPIVGTDGTFAILENGDVYYYNAGVPRWDFCNNALSGVVGVPPASSASGLRVEIAPNPTRDGISASLSLPSASDVEVQIVDVQGRSVAPALQLRLPAGRSQPIGPLLGESRSLQPGTYFVRVRAGSQFVTSRAVVLP